MNLMVYFSVINHVEHLVIGLLSVCSTFFFCLFLLGYQKRQTEQTNNFMMNTVENNRIRD